MMKTKQIVQRAFEQGIVVPALNIPHLPMMAPVVRALQDSGAFALIQVSRIEWEKFQAKSLRAIRDEYERCKDERVTRLHLDHVPVIDEDQKVVDYLAVLAEAIELGYESLMVDGSRLSLEDNIAQTKAAVDLAHVNDVPIEAELGAVMGHEDGPMPPYEELFASRQGFTDPQQARQFVQETEVDWLSVAIGNIHGAISVAKRDSKKVTARLNIEHLDEIKAVTGVPMVLHGGSGIAKQSILDGVAHGIAKINVGTTLRQAYETGAKESAEAADRAVYEATTDVAVNELEIAGSAAKLLAT